MRSRDLKEVGTLLQRDGPRWEIDCWHILVEHFGIILELFLVLYREWLVTKIFLNTEGFLFLLCLNINTATSLNKSWSIVSISYFCLMSVMSLLWFRPHASRINLSHIFCNLFVINCNSCLVYLCPVNIKPLCLVGLYLRLQFFCL